MSLDLSQVSGQVVADVIGITRRQVTNLTQMDVLKQTAKGKYSLADAVQAYLKWRDGGRVLEGRRRLEDVKARREELLFDQLSGRLISIEDAQVVVNEAMVIIATQMDALPGRMASDLAGESDPAAVRQKLLTEQRRIRAAAADRLARLAIAGSGSADPAPTTGTKRRPVGKRKQGAAGGKRRARAVAE